MKRKQWVGLVISAMVGISTVLPAQASVLSQSQVVTVTGGHYYTTSVYEQTGTQQVQTGTTTQTVTTYQETGVSGTCEHVDTETVNEYNDDFISGSVEAIGSNGTSYSDTYTTSSTYNSEANDWGLVCQGDSKALDGKSFQWSTMVSETYAGQDYTTVVDAYWDAEYTENVDTTTTETVPIYTTEPVYGYVSETAWSPASISYS